MCDHLKCDWLLVLHLELHWIGAGCSGCPFKRCLDSLSKKWSSLMNSSRFRDFLILSSVYWDTMVSYLSRNEFVVNERATWPVFFLLNHLGQNGRRSDHYPLDRAHHWRFNRTGLERDPTTSCKGRQRHHCRSQCRQVTTRNWLRVGNPFLASWPRC